MTDHAYGSQGSRPTVAMLLYPGLTLIDLVAPLTAFALGMDVHLVWKNTAPITSDTGTVLHPTTSFADCPAELDIVFVPGGQYQAPVAGDEEVLAFLADRGSRARYVTSVCGGSLLLGAAGLLRGYRAATHWSSRHILPLLGAENVTERVVIDRNRITGGGATAGLDFGLVVVAELLGNEAAKLAQLVMEYDPQPPFDSGTPEKAGADLTREAARFLQPIQDGMADALENLAVRRWETPIEAGR
ncbi:MAG TPA: DJ-1/PfpI family protein [Jatrophihabitans sp.]|jgi:transcriptional regulator GlxA family with amidase domain